MNHGLRVFQLLVTMFLLLLLGFLLRVDELSSDSYIGCDFFSFFFSGKV